TRLDDLAVHADAGFDVRAAFASSYDRLGEPERSVLRLLSLLRTPHVTARQAAALLGCDVDRAERLLARLAECSLLSVVPGQAAEACYALHELVRLFARECLEAELDAYSGGASGMSAVQAEVIAEPLYRGIGPVLRLLNPGTS
ncbi:MAG TPA: hypothetical protein VIR33_11965, partial [Thermopolyspora sp.]